MQTCGKCGTTRNSFEEMLLHRSCCKGSAKNSQERERVVSLEPGPVLDREVAEKVMGWSYSTVKEYEWFRPSTNLDAAYKVIKKMDSQDWDTKILVRGSHHRVEFGTVSAAERMSTPHAVCIAALLAVME